MQSDDLTRLKTSKLLQLIEAKAVGNRQAVRELSTEAADLESKIADAYLRDGDRENAAISLTSQASCLVEADRLDEAGQVLDRAYDLTAKSPLRKWILEEKERIAASAGSKPIKAGPATGRRALAGESGGYVPPFRESYAVFVRLPQLTPQLPADGAYRQTMILDSALKRLSDGAADRFLPSPYGGAILLQEVGKALDSAAELMNVLTANNIDAAIAITRGTFTRNFSITHLNVTALALNSAARMASGEEARGQISVSELVKQDALRSATRFQGAFGPARHGIVKDFEFTCYTYAYERRAAAIEAGIPSGTSQPSNAHVLVVDIVKYSQKKPEEQHDAVEQLNRCLEAAIAATGAEPFTFGPAGDGGYFVFPSGNSGSAPLVLNFADKIVRLARKEDLRIRIGVSFGPVLTTVHRSAVGGTILLADEVSGFSPILGLAVSSDVWEDLPASLRGNWQEREGRPGPGIVALTLPQDSPAAKKIPPATAPVPPPSPPPRDWRLRLLRDILAGAAGSMLAAYIWAILPRPIIPIPVDTTKSGEPITISVTKIPTRLPEGETTPSRWIAGEVRGLNDPRNYFVVVYSYSRMWYVQPSIFHPLTGVDASGHWQNMIQGGSYYAALLVKPGFTPPPQTETLPTNSPDVITWRVVEGKADFQFYFLVSFGVFLLAYSGISTILLIRRRRRARTEGRSI